MAISISWGQGPERPEFVEKLTKLIPYYSLRHTVRPGLTGWAQVMFPYCGTIEESKEKLQYDLFYIKNMSDQARPADPVQDRENRTAGPGGTVSIGVRVGIDGRIFGSWVRIEWESK